MPGRRHLRSPLLAAQMSPRCPRDVPDQPSSLPLRRPGLPLHRHGRQLTINDEVTAFRWATAAEVTDLTAETYAIRVLDALSDGPGPAVRQHDGTRVFETQTKPTP